ncbi:MAG: HD-GYP domain-containing protein [Spirochaetaceae bacterium]
MRPITFNLNDFLLSLSFALDFVEMDILGASSNHSKRVGLIAVKMGKLFGLDESELFDLCSFSILHDNGLSEEVLHRKITLSEKEKCTIRGLEKYFDHCEYGERNLVNFPFQTDHTDIVKYHHERYDGGGVYGIEGENIPFPAQLIALADTVDNLFHFEKTDVENRKSIRDFIEKRKGSWYSKKVGEAFLELSDPPGFWLELQNPFIYKSIKDYIPARSSELTWREVLKISRVFSRIIDSKSKFTFRHSSGIEEKAATMAEYYGFDEERYYKLLVAASLHDLGKLVIPNSILNKPGSLEEEEYELIQTHAFYTRKGLEELHTFDDICSWASNHHERLDGSGYPYRLEAPSLGFEDRLLMCLDIYQALTEDRPYRAALSHGKAANILRELAREGKIDAQVTRDLEEVFHPG